MAGVLVNALQREGWRLLACGVVERRTVDQESQPASGAHCAFILGRSRAEQALAAADRGRRGGGAGAAGRPLTGRAGACAVVPSRRAARG